MKLSWSPVMKPVDDQTVWSIVCFFVDRSVRGQGLSKRMPKSMFDRAGFREVARRKPTRPVVPKALRPASAAKSS